MEIGKRVPGIEPALCRLRDLRLYRSLHEEVSLKLACFLWGAAYNTRATNSG